MLRLCLTLLLFAPPFAAQAQPNPLDGRPFPELPQAKQANGEQRVETTIRPLPQNVPSVDFFLNGFDVRYAEDPSINLSDIEAALQPLVGRVVSFSEIETARQAITELYISRGFVSSGALIPDQTIEGGVVVIDLIEGKAVELIIEGQGIGAEGWGALDPAYIADRIREGGETFNVDRLQKRLELLLRGRNVRSLRIRVRPGVALGEVVLNLNAVAARPAELTVTFDNSSPPSVGEETIKVAGKLRNIYGFGDEVSAELRATQGLRAAKVGFDAPLSPTGVSLFADAETSFASVVEDPLDDLDIESWLIRLGAGLRMPVIRTNRRSLVAELGVDWSRSETRILGRPFSFSPGVRNGHSQNTALRGALEYLQRDEVFSLALRTEARLGLDILGARDGVGDLGPSAEFISWIGQAQAIVRLDPALSLRARGQAQISSGRLPPSEDISVGGAATVRGYRENALVTDQAVVFSFEAQAEIGAAPLPGLTPSHHPATVFLSPFLDIGWAFDFGESKTTLIGAGARLDWRLSPNAMLSLTGAHGFRDLPGPNQKGSLQDDGIYLSFAISFP